MNDRQESGYSAALLSIDGSAVAASGELETTAQAARVRGHCVLSSCAIMGNRGPARVFEDNCGSAQHS